MFYFFIEKVRFSTFLFSFLRKPYGIICNLFWILTEQLPDLENIEFSFHEQEDKISFSILFSIECFEANFVLVGEISNKSIVKEWIKILVWYDLRILLEYYINFTDNYKKMYKNILKIIYKLISQDP